MTLRKAGNGCVEEVSDRELDAALLTGRPVVLDVYAEWCGPCKLMEPTLSALALRFQDSGVRVLRMDSDAFPARSSALRVEGLPTLIFFTDSIEVHRLEGVADIAELQALMERLFGLVPPADGVGGAVTVERASSLEEVELAMQMEDSLVLAVLASWVETSQLIEPALELLAQSLHELPAPPRLLVVDATELPGVVASVSTRALPTLLLFREGELLAEVSEIDESLPDSLLAIVEEAFGFRVP